MEITALASIQRNNSAIVAEHTLTSEVSLAVKVCIVIFWSMTPQI
jgi:hypothetical protein